MAENIIGLKSVRELLGLNFFIPDYQRGYRWTAQQVEFTVISGFQIE